MHFLSILRPIPVINASAATKDNKWQHVIDPHHGSGNWYERHQEDYGSLKWITAPWRVSILVFGAWIGTIGWFLFADYSASLQMALFWCSVLLYSLCTVGVCLVIIIFILRKISILDDPIGLAKAVKFILRLTLLVSAVLVLFVVVCDNIVIPALGWGPRPVPTSQFMFRVLFMGMHWRVTKCVVVKSSDIISGSCNVPMGPRTSLSDHKKISLNALSNLNIRAIVHESTLEKDDTDAGGEQNKHVQMKDTLKESKMFDHFMRSLLKEYCEECLFSIIEMVQFKERILKRGLKVPEEDSVESGEMMDSPNTDQSVIGQDLDHFLIIPKDCPSSIIVHGEYSGDTNAHYKTMARELFLKYVRHYSPHEINISGDTRQLLSDLMDNEQRWASNEEHDDPQKL